MITAWIITKKPDLGQTLNGALAGLVAITAPCAWVTPAASIVIGAVGGVIVVLGAIAHHEHGAEAYPNDILGDLAPMGGAAD